MSFFSSLLGQLEGVNYGQNGSDSISVGMSDPPPRSLPSGSLANESKKASHMEACGRDRNSVEQTKLLNPLSRNKLTVNVNDAALKRPKEEKSISSLNNTLKLQSSSAMRSKDQVVAARSVTSAVTSVAKKAPSLACELQSIKPAPRKGSYLEILERAKAGQEASKQIGAIKHKLTERNSSLHARNSRRYSKTTTSVLNPASNSTQAEETNSESVRKRERQLDPVKSSTVTSRAPSYKGTMNLSRNQTNAASKSSVSSLVVGKLNDKSVTNQVALGSKLEKSFTQTKSAVAMSNSVKRTPKIDQPQLKKPRLLSRPVLRQERYLDEDEDVDEDDDGNEDSYESSDMEAGLSDMEREEMESLRIAEKEDKEALIDETRRRREKLLRKQSLK